MWRTVIALALFAVTLGRSLMVTTETAPSFSTNTSIGNTSRSALQSTDDMMMKTTAASDQDPTTSTGEDEMAKMMDIQNQCNDTFRIQNGYLEELVYNGSFPDETDRTPKCFVRCMLERMGVVSSEGVFNVSQDLQMFSTGQGGESDQEVMTKCAADRKETCKCEKSYQFYKCLVQMKMRAEKERASYNP